MTIVCINPLISCWLGQAPFGWGNPNGITSPLDTEGPLGENSNPGVVARQGTAQNDWVAMGKRGSSNCNRDVTVYIVPNAVGVVTPLDVEQKELLDECWGNLQQGIRGNWQWTLGPRLD